MTIAYRKSINMQNNLLLLYSLQKILYFCRPTLNYKIKYTKKVKKSP